MSGNSKYLDERGMVTPNHDNHTPDESDGVKCFWPEAEATGTVEALEMWWREQMKRAPAAVKAMREYFSQAWQEIKEFSLVLKSGQWPSGKVEVSRDMAGWFIVSGGNSSVVFSRDEGESKDKSGAAAYSGFLAFVAKHITSGNSFVLRYLHIRNLRMSSGERAFQNFFSWLYAVPALQGRRLRDNLLLLVDEIDLYQHPQWQKNFLKRMLEMLDVCYHGKKVQVIFTTHSPLCLSDMPRENCVYIGFNRQENRRWIKPRNVSPFEQTFGRDIYALLQDGFFLHGSPMGAIADSYIVNLLRDMQVERKKILIEETVEEWNKDYLVELGEKIGAFQRRANRIGNVPLRKKIQSMLEVMRRWRQYVFFEAKNDKKE